MVRDVQPGIEKCLNWHLHVKCQTAVFQTSVSSVARKGIFEQEESGFCCNDKIGIVLSSDLTASETFHFDSVGLDARLDTDIRKISGLIMN